jgi:hypothetical protein
MDQPDVRHPTSRWALLSGEIETLDWLTGELGMRSEVLVEVQNGELGQLGGRGDQQIRDGGGTVLAALGQLAWISTARSSIRGVRYSTVAAVVTTPSRSSPSRSTSSTRASPIVFVHADERYGPVSVPGCHRVDTSVPE